MLKRMEKVYVSIKHYSQNSSDNILGIYSNRNDAIKKCLAERSFVREGWKSVDGVIDQWENGAGIYVMVSEYTVE